MTHLLVFLAYFVLDIVWALYTKAIAKGDALRAAFWAGVIPALVLLSTTEVVTDRSLIWAAAGGGAIGTWVALSSVAFVGATAYEAQIGRLWVRVLRPRFWGCGKLVEFGWQRDE